MALTITFVNKQVSGNKKIIHADVAFDSSYPTGGEALTPANLTLGRIDYLNAEPTGGRGFRFDRTNNKLMAYGGTTEVADTTDLSAVTTRIRAEGA